MASYWAMLMTNLHDVIFPFKLMNILGFCNLVLICKDVFLGCFRPLAVVQAVFLRLVVMCADVCMRECYQQLLN